MSEICFPFLLLTRRGSYRSVTTSDGDLAVAFSSVQKAAAFMEERKESNWEFALVIRSGLDQVVGDLRRASLKGVCVDRRPDETGGTLVKVSDLELIVSLGKHEG